MILHSVADGWIRIWGDVLQEYLRRRKEKLDTSNQGKLIVRIMIGPRNSSVSKHSLNDVQSVSVLRLKHIQL